MYIKRAIEATILKISKMFPDKMNIGNGAVICMMPKLLPIDSRNWYVPAWLI
ncbi:MAG TPA: hypothetical protein GXX37_09865 [Clostridiaceae bacterium]|nr:hypothetical protein [Clostridiaceae bacterium]